MLLIGVVILVISTVVVAAVLYRLMGRKEAAAELGRDDDEADAEGQLIVVGEEADLLRDAVFDDGEVVPGEAGYDAAVRVVDAESGVDEVCLYLEDGDALRERKSDQKNRAHQKKETRHDWHLYL